MHAKRTLLFDKETPWGKRNNSAKFDVSMGSYDGAEICELVGLYMLHMLDQRFNNNKHTGLYRDDGLAVFRTMAPRTAEEMKKRIEKVFTYSSRIENNDCDKSESR